MFDAKRIKDEIIEWIRNYFDENGNGCSAVIGISGGKDSSIVAALCVKALGPDRVYGVLMPHGNQHDIQIARDLVEYLGMRHCVINIKDSTGAVYEALDGCGIKPNNVVITNTPSRMRMTFIYAVNAVLGGRVAGTSNLSEDWVGYSTKFGVGAAADFSPLLRLTATEVKALGAAMGMPAKFTDKIPEDGLSGLTDEENLGFTYDVLDRYIREKICENAEIKEKIDRLHRLNLHKVNPVSCYEMTPDA